MLLRQSQALLPQRLLLKQPCSQSKDDEKASNMLVRYERDGILLPLGYPKS